MDKAALLGHAVDSREGAATEGEGGEQNSSGVPSEINEVIVDQIEDGSEQIRRRSAATIGRSSLRRSGAC